MVMYRGWSCELIEIEIDAFCLLGMNDGIDSLSKWKAHQLIEMVTTLIESVNGVGLVVHRVC